MDPRTPSVPPNRQGDVGAAETRRQGPRVPKGKSFNPRMCQETRGVKIEDKTWTLETPLTRPRSRAPTVAPAVPERPPRLCRAWQQRRTQDAGETAFRSGPRRTSLASVTGKDGAQRNAAER